MRVSVVVINHNYAAFVRAAIDSALAQSGAEVVVVDDGSSDDSAEIIREYGDRIRTVFQPQSGHVLALNAGFKAATGELVIFLDADDLLHPDCVAQVLGAWEPGLSKIQYRLDTIDENGVDQAMPFPYFPPDLGPEQIRAQSLRRGTYPWTVSSGNAFARAYLERVLPIEAGTFFKSPDGYLNKLAPLFGDVKSLNRILGAYRVHGRNLWAQSQSRLNLKPLIDNVAFDQVMHERFARLAAERGYKVPAFDSICVPPQVEVRLLAFRFAGRDYPLAGDTRWSLLGLGLRAACTAPNTSPIGRGLWALWLATIALAPAPLLRWMHGKFRSQSGRAPASRYLVSLARGRAQGSTLALDPASKAL